MTQTITLTVSRPKEKEVTISSGTMKAAYSPLSEVEVSYLKGVQDMVACMVHAGVDMTDAKLLKAIGIGYGMALCYTDPADIPTIVIKENM